MGSFENINYSLRPNKNVERKLMIECLQGLSRGFNFSDYAYIGLGSMWFVDFILIHKYLSINDLTSIEMESFDRAWFNRPFSCVKVEEGETTKVLPTLSLEDKQSVIWLDYDSGLEGPVLTDSQTICERVPSGSIYMVSLNANISPMRNVEDEDGRKLSEEEALRLYAGALVPTPLPKDATTTLGYPNLLAKMLFDHFRRATRKAGRKERFIPIFNFAYKDNAQMITVAGMIANEDDAHRLEETLRSLRLDYITREEQFTISIPHLTLKEKLALDQILPSDFPPSIAAVAALGFSLRERQIKSYHRFYRYYPTFGELSM